MTESADIALICDKIVNKDTAQTPLNSTLNLTYFRPEPGLDNNS